jgi:hypothetical protein
MADKVPVELLYKFYDVGSDDALIMLQHEHILKLQNAIYGHPDQKVLINMQHEQIVKLQAEFNKTHKSPQHYYDNYRKG